VTQLRNDFIEFDIFCMSSSDEIIPNDRILLEVEDYDFGEEANED
jgi:hypothetical protein